MPPAVLLSVSVLSNPFLLTPPTFPLILRVHHVYEWLVWERRGLLLVGVWALVAPLLVPAYLLAHVMRGFKKVRSRRLVKSLVVAIPPRIFGRLVATL